MMTTYDEMRRALNDNNEDKRSEGWPPWLPFALSVLIVVVTVTLAYSSLEKRISLMEQKLDYVVQRVAQ